MMDIKPFDPNNIRIEDIFRAKEERRNERRKRLANLPFEEKINLVEQLNTVVRTFLEKQEERTMEDRKSQR
jgi:hypothetical protein